MPSGPQCNCVRTGVAGAGENFFRLNDLNDLKLLRIRLSVNDMDAGRTQSRDNQEAPFKVGVRSIRAQGRTAGVPAEVMQFVADVGEIQAADHAAVRGRGWINVDDEHGVAARFVVWRESRDVR